MRYRVIIDLGWHEANSSSEAINNAMSQKWTLEKLAYHAVPEPSIIKKKDYGYICECEQKSDEIEQAWAHYHDPYNHDPYNY